MNLLIMILVMMCFALDGDDNHHHCCTAKVFPFCSNKGCLVESNTGTDLSVQLLCDAKLADSSQRGLKKIPCFVCQLFPVGVMRQHGTCSATVDFPICHGPDNHLEADHEDPATINVQKKHRWVLAGQVVCRRVEGLKGVMFAKTPRGTKRAHEFLAVCQLPCLFLATHVLMK